MRTRASVCYVFVNKVTLKEFESKMAVWYLPLSVKMSPSALMGFKCVLTTRYSSRKLLKSLIDTCRRGESSFWWVVLISSRVGRVNRWPRFVRAKPAEVCCCGWTTGYSVESGARPAGSRGPLDHYGGLIRDGALREDEHQKAVMQTLDQLHKTLRGYSNTPMSFFSKVRGLRNTPMVMNAFILSRINY